MSIIYSRWCVHFEFIQFARIYLKFSSNYYPAKQHWFIIIFLVNIDWLCTSKTSSYYLCTYWFILPSAISLGQPHLKIPIMVVFNFKIEHFLFPELINLCYLIMITYFFSILTPFTSAISFNFTGFSSYDSNITYARAFAVTKSSNSQAISSHWSMLVKPHISN